MAKVLIIGASRGIGLEFVRQYRARGDEVIATARHVEGCEALAALGAQAVRLDVIDEDAQDTLAAVIGRGSLDLAIFNAGILIGRDAAPTAPDAATFAEVMKTNVWAPMRMIEPLSTWLKDGGKLVVLSSRMGSIGERSNASSWLYRASKAAVNSVLKDASIFNAARGITCVAMHPGWVKTDMGGAGADLEVSVSVAGMVASIDRYTTTDNGSFRNYDGTAIAW
jgi:NAD(P)-dependent dehydrogenase (short-subunit alcohol dehydrogenase family)